MSIILVNQFIGNGGTAPRLYLVQATLEKVMGKGWVTWEWLWRKKSFLFLVTLLNGIGSIVSKDCLRSENLNSSSVANFVNKNC